MHVKQYITLRGGRRRLAVMSMPKNELDKLLTEAVLSDGLTRKHLLTSVRDYINKTPPDQLMREIAQIQKRSKLRMLNGAGVPYAIKQQFEYQYSQSVE